MISMLDSVEGQASYTNKRYLLFDLFVSMNMPFFLYAERKEIICDYTKHYDEKMTHDTQNSDADLPVKEKGNLDASSRQH